MNTRSIILNSSHIVSGTNNTALRYNFTGAEDFKDKEIAVASIQMYNSVFNIDSALYNNSTFQYMWYNSSGVLNQTFDVVLPNGYYNSGDLNEYFIFIMTSRGHFMKNTSTGANTYYYSIIDNVSRYGVQITCSKLPQTGDITATFLKGGSWGTPTTSSCGQIKFLSTNNFSYLIGFEKGQSLPSSTQSTTYTTLSEITPKQLMVSSILLTTNLVDNKYASPSNLLTSFTISQADFGTMAIINPNNLIWQSCGSPLTNYLELRMYDQNMRPFKIQDSQMLFNLIIRDKEKVKE